MKKTIYIVLRDVTYDYDQHIDIVLLTESLDTASSCFQKEREAAASYADKMGFVVDSCGDDSFESYRDGEAVVDHYNVHLRTFQMETPDPEEKKPSVGEKMSKALGFLEDIPSSGYWPYASPAPCSTEVAIKKSLNVAIAHLQQALSLHELMFGKTGRNPMRATSMKIEQ